MRSSGCSGSATHRRSASGVYAYTPMCWRTVPSSTARSSGLAKGRNRRPRKVQRAAVVGTHDFHDVRRLRAPRAARARPRCRARTGRPRRSSTAPSSAAPADERLVALHVENHVEAPVLGVRDHLGHAIGAGGVVVARQHALGAGLDAPAAATSGLSVAMTHRSATSRAMTRCQTRMTMGTPARSRSGLRGSRVAERRAGMIASVLTAMIE